ncbi:MAG TPA: DUF1501 domain-containing protein [Planctomycetaceae bacterium]|nr:DUF1501 domain-containing protein [Planctomycetaceae bacterium]
MLTLKDTHGGYSSRRQFLTMGALTAGGLTLAELLRAEAATGIGSSRKSIFFVHLDGGPPQMDTIDPKPLAPSELRGEFQPISTSTPGLQLCELLPQLAQNSERFVFIRSLIESAGRHDGFQCQSGYHYKDLESIGGRPAMGSVLAKLQGSATDVAPMFIDLMQGRPLVRNSARPGFLGPSYQAFRPDISQMFERELESGMKNELARLGTEHSTALTLNADLSETRLDSRTELLAGLDRIKRDVDASGMMDAMDQFTQQAVGILTSGKLAEALDVSREDPEILARYTPRIQEQHERFYTAEGPKSVLKFLLARRMIEAGVRCVSISLSDFDTHSSNFPRMRNLLPVLDHGMNTLVTDLTERGMIDDVTIVAWGEFGRTPRINDKGGRDHWPRVGPAILAGGGLKTGQVIGATDRTASAVTERPVTYRDVFATLYRTLGIDALRTTITDPRGRPQYLIDQGQPISELL